MLLKGAKATGRTSDSNFIADLLSKIKPVVSLLIGVEVNEIGETDEFEPLLAAESWTEFPLPNHWQSFSQKAISRLAYNLCVACDVSCFSGWNTDEFRLDSLKKRGGREYFGVNIRDERVVGHVSSETEVELLQEWERVGKLMPWASSFDFKGALSTVKNSEWYESAKATAESGYDHKTIATHGEEDGMKILLMFSNLCLLVAEASPTKAASDALIKTALSVLLPVVCAASYLSAALCVLIFSFSNMSFTICACVQTQFCVEQHLWLSPIGAAAASQPRGNAWSHFSVSNSKQQEAPDHSAPPQMTHFQERNAAKSQTRAVGKHHGRQQGQSPFATKFVKISTASLVMEWTKGKIADGSPDGVSESAQQAMRKVDVVLGQLRSCFTIGALQKTSVQVAAALLDLVAQEGHCSNPFLCLQQAAIFASQGAKGGSNDECFKKPLPSERDCTPLEALTIIGRADCLQALDFPNEAIFLCSYVTRVSCLRRDRQQADLPWTPQWRVVGIAAYNVGVSIDKAVRSFETRDDGRKLQVEPWDKLVLEELDRGRADAIALLRSFGAEGSDSSPLMEQLDLIDKHLADDMCNFRSLEDESEIPVGSDDDDESEKISVVAV